MVNKNLKVKKKKPRQTHKASVYSIVIPCVHIACHGLAQANWLENQALASPSGADVGEEAGGDALGDE